MAKPDNTDKVAFKIDPNAWMVTFSDLLMLMLTFFVLLLTMSSLDAQKVQEIARSGIHTADMGSPGAAASIIEPLVTVNTQVESDIMRVADGAPSDRAADSLEQSLATHHLEGASWLERRPEGLVVSVDGRVAFAPGTDTLTPRALAFLEDFARVAAAVDTNVAAEAFVANPLDPYRDDAHWALAAERADAVATTLLRFGVSGARLSASAYGYPGGRDELRFLQQQELLELTLLTGPNTAVPAE